MSRFFIITDINHAQVYLELPPPAACTSTHASAKAADDTNHAQVYLELPPPAARTSTHASAKAAEGVQGSGAEAPESKEAHVVFGGGGALGGGTGVPIR
jgi:hypothetical protein